LADFAKTPIIEPAASANVTMSVKVKDLASYDYSDANATASKAMNSKLEIILSEFSKTPMPVR
jgi:hypothetical protein